jgi:hypothetical protein
MLIFNTHYVLYDVILKSLPILTVYMYSIFSRLSECYKMNIHSYLQNKMSNDPNCNDYVTKPAHFINFVAQYSLKSAACCSCVCLWHKVI